MYVCTYIHIYIYHSWRQLRVAALAKTGPFSPAFTCVHLRSPAFTCVHLRSSAFTYVHLRSLAFTRVHLRSPAFTCVHLRLPSVSVRNASIVTFTAQY